MDGDNDGSGELGYPEDTTIAEVEGHLLPQGEFADLCEAGNAAPFPPSSD